MIYLLTFSLDILNELGGKELHVAIWIILVMVFLVIEACTITLLTTWFAVGAAVSAVLALCGVGFGWQIGVFFVVSIALILAARPIFNKFLQRRTPTNKDDVIGTNTYVTEDIDNLAQTGYVKIKDVYWTARSADGQPIPSGTLVTIEEIQGNKLIVRKSQ